MVSLFMRGYSDNTTGDYSFGFAAGYGKGDMGPMNTHLIFYTYNCWLGGGYFFHIVVGIVNPRVIGEKSPLINCLRGGTIILVFLVMVVVVLVLLTPTLPPIYLF